MSFRVDSLATLRDLHARLAEEGLVNLGPVSHGNALSVYFRDPEGNRIELLVDTPWYIPQPYRIPIDLSMEDEALWAWAEAHARSIPGFMTRAELVEAYARRSGRDVSHVGFYQVLALAKLAVIAEGIYARHQQGLTVGEGFRGMRRESVHVARRALALAEDVLPG